MSKIKLFVDAHVFDEKYQGTRTFLKGLYTHMADSSGLDIYMAALDVENLKQEFGYHKNFHYLAYKSPSKIYRLLVDIPYLIKRYNIDIAHFQYISPLIKTCKEIITIHDLLFNDFKEDFSASYRISKNILFKKSARRADLLTTVSDYSADRITQHYQIPKSNIYLTPNGIEPIFFNFPSGQTVINVKGKYLLQKYILYVSRVEPRKNHLLLLKAYHGLALYEKNISLVMIGKNDLSYKDFEDYYQSLPEPVKKHVVRLEDINLQELLNFYYHADLFIYPSKAEGFGIPPLEAAAMKVNTLCSASTAMADFRFFGDNLFDPTDIEEIKKKITFALESGSSSEKKQEIADIILNKYNWKKIAASFTNKIQELF